MSNPFLKVTESSQRIKVLHICSTVSENGGDSTSEHRQSQQSSLPGSLLSVGRNGRGANEDSEALAVSLVIGSETRQAVLFRLSSHFRKYF